MLEIGIPCIIASKRKRFKAYARYIGEVLGERGPWVGVEVPLPLGDAAWGDDGIAAQQQRDDRAWHDGTWGGVRYFEIGGGVGGSEWEYGYGGEGDRAARRRRVAVTRKRTKRMSAPRVLSSSRNSRQDASFRVNLVFDALCSLRRPVYMLKTSRSLPTPDITPLRPSRTRPRRT